jgi:iron complex transport system substrate-binding protein
MQVQPDTRRKARQDVVMHASYPTRIVCLTEETTETLYLLGEEDRIVGISGFTVRPARARREKPRVSAFTTAKLDAIRALEPDLVLGFSDLQADIASALIRSGIAVHVFNQRNVAGILGMIRVLGGMIGCAAKAEALCVELQAKLEVIAAAAATFGVRPRVYFEEWDAPMITAIEWVSELIELAGGSDCFLDMRGAALAKNRIVADPMEIVRRAPDIIIGSWCGKKFRPETVSARPGWQAIPAVVAGELHEIKSCLILQPGPAALTDGLDALHEIVRDWVGRQTSTPDPARAP